VRSSGQVITLSVGREYTDPDNCYLQKLQAVLEGGTGDDCNGGTYTFTGMPYYLTNLNGESGGEANNFDLYGSACGQVGIYDGGSIRPGGALPILDICPACVDCGDYEDIKILTDRIREFQYWDVSRNLHDPTLPNIGELALFRQYQATIHYWNYLVHKQTIPLELVRSTDKIFAIRSGYFNKSCQARAVTQVLNVVITYTGGTAPAPDDITFDLTNVKSHKDSELAPPTIAKDKVSDTEYDVTITYPTMQYKDFFMWEIVAKAKDNSTDFALVDVTVLSTWTGTHLGPPPVEVEKVLTI
jgi:hypothetical protein